MPENTFNHFVEKIAPSASMQIGLAPVASEYNLAIGSPDISAPEFIRRAIADYALMPDYHYQPTKGSKLVLERIHSSVFLSNHIDPEKNLCVVPGAKYGIYLTLKTVTNTGDTVLLLQPYWLSYPAICQSLGLNIISAEYDFGTNSYDVDSICQMLQKHKVKVLLLNNPNNPLGFVMSPADIDRLINTCERLGIWLLIDEVYKDLVFDSTLDLHNSIISDCVLRVGSFSKSLAIAGLRIGYVSGSHVFMKNFNLLNQHIITCVNALSTYALSSMTVDRFKEFTAYCSLVYKQRYQIAAAKLKELDYTVLPSEAAFYMLVNTSALFPNGDKATEYLQSKGILVTPGRHYGPQFTNCIRICLTTPTETLEKVLMKFIA